MSEPNWELFAKVRDRIAEVGNEHCRMDRWVTGEVFGNGEPDCGTTACIAGWACAIERGKYTIDQEALAAVRYLGLDSGALFYLENWPVEYNALRRAEGDAKGMLAILDDILDRKIDPNTLEPLAVRGN